MKQIVVIGAGSAGVAFAQAAAKNLSPSEAKITIIEKCEFFYHVFGSLRAMVDTTFIPKVVIPYDNAFSAYPDVDLKFASVDSISYETNIVTYTPNASSDDAANPNPPQQKTLQYDYLVLATGSSYPSPIKPQGMTRTPAAIKTELANTAKKIRSSSKIMVIGGGAVGIEMAGELKTFYPKKKIMLIDRNAELLSNQQVPKLRGPIKEALQELGVELFLGQRLTGERFTSHQFGTKNLVTESGLIIESDAQLVCAGMKPNSDLMKDPRCLDGHFITIKLNMQVDSAALEYEKVFVLGDASDHPTPKLGYWAGLQGQHLAKSIAEHIRNGKQFEEYVGPSTEVLILPLGPDGGLTHLPLCGGLVAGNFLTRMFKSKDLMAGMSWKMLNAEMPS